MYTILNSLIYEILICQITDSQYGVISTILSYVINVFINQSLSRISKRTIFSV